MLTQTYAESVMTFFLDLKARPLCVDVLPSIPWGSTRPHPTLTRRHVRHERKVLDQAAALPFGRVGGAQHAPLARVKRARTADL